MLRSACKRVAETLLLHGGASQAAKYIRHRRIIVLAYHNILPDDAAACGDRSLHLHRRRFAEQLDALRREVDVVPLHELLSRPTDERPRPRAAITFDDAYRGAVVLGVEELSRRGLPATFFVAPAFLGRRSFWWDDLAEGNGAGLSPSVRDRALGELRGLDPAIREWARDAGLRTNGSTHALTATEDELRSALGRPGISVASHTWSHPNLTRVGAPELKEELLRPLEWLRTRFDRVIPWLSYPYGLSSNGVEEAVDSAGYQAAVLITGGWLTGQLEDQRFAVPRLNVASGLSLRGFRVRLAGLLC